jgi:hypothetical protein
MRGPFFYIAMKVNYTKTCTLPQDLIPLLKSRGLTISDALNDVFWMTQPHHFIDSFFYSSF